MTTFAQGEIYGRKVEAAPDGLVPFNDRNNAGDWIVSHSESGNHHLLDGGVDLLEKPSDKPGLRILYAIVKNPATLRQNAGGNAHEPHTLAPGVYEMRIAREYYPFSQQARRVAD